MNVQPQRACVVATVREPGPPMISFVRHHLALGFRHVFLFFDDPTDADLGRARALPQVTAVACDETLRATVWPTCRRYASMQPFLDTEVMARQVLNAELALRWALERGDEWLVHLDVDELLFLPEPAPAVFAGLERDVGEVVFVNHEAVPERLHALDYFREVTLFKQSPLLCSRVAIDRWRERSKRRWYFHAYENGKSAVRVLPGRTPAGVHAFDGVEGLRRIVAPKGCVLHYPHCGIEAFTRKYRHRGRFSDAYFGGTRRIDFHLRSRDVVASGTPSDISRFYRDNVVFEREQDAALLVDAGLGFRVTSVARALSRVAPEREHLPQEEG